MTTTEQLHLIWFFLNPFSLPFPEWVIALPIRVAATTLFILALGHWLQRRNPPRPYVSPFANYTPGQILRHNAYVSGENWHAAQEGTG